MSNEVHDNSDSAQLVESNIRVGFGIHSGSPDRWGWEVSGKNGYGWGTEQTEKQAMLDCITYMMTNLL